MKRIVRKLARKIGYDIIKFEKDKMGIHPFYDMAKFIKIDNPMLFDVGANVGQTIKDFNEVFKNGTIHAFEPTPSTIDILKNNTSSIKNVHIWNHGMGAQSGELLINEYAHSNTNSFLDIHHAKSKKKTLVKVKTVDQFCMENKIDKIDVLKIDTEGFELEVFKGSSNLFSNNKIGMLFFEVGFRDSHNNMPTFTELFNYALNQDFELISIYPIIHRNKKAGYTNLLFKHKTY